MQGVLACRRTPSTGKEKKIEIYGFVVISTSNHLFIIITWQEIL